MKQITNKEYIEYERYKQDKIKGRILNADGIRFICQALDYDPQKIGEYFLEKLGEFNKYR